MPIIIPGFGICSFFFLPIDIKKISITSMNNGWDFLIILNNGMFIIDNPNKARVTLSKLNSDRGNTVANVLFLQHKFFAHFIEEGW